MQVSGGEAYIPGDQVDAALLQVSPAGLPNLGSNLGQFISRQLARPVSLYGLFDLTVRTYKTIGRVRKLTSGGWMQVSSGRRTNARETENTGSNHSELSEERDDERKKRGDGKP